MTRYGMLINTRRCVGCFSCRVACQMNNSLPANESFIRYETIERGVFPNVRAEEVPTQCRHCDGAPCVSVCPTGASYINDDGVVLVDEKSCIGCYYCMLACPHQARIIHRATKTPEKCRFCVLKDDGTEPKPTCVGTCITHARIFGDLDDPESEISKAIIKYNAAPIGSDQTKSKVYYVR